MDVSTVIELIQGVGFPIGVSIYLLVYMKKEMEDNRKALYDIRMVIQSLSDFLKREVQ